jgi:hypothetical protein
LGFGIGLKIGNWDLEFGIWKLGFGTWDLPKDIRLGRVVYPGWFGGMISILEVRCRPFSA